MTSDSLKDLVVTTLDDNKAQEITAIDVRDLTQVTDYFVIATATSTRHAKSLADKVGQAAKAQNVMPLSTTGEEAGEWVLLDLQDVVVHIMLPEARQFYQLEKLWGMTEAIRQQR